MSRYGAAVLVATALTLGTVVWAASRVPAGEATARADCVTAEQVLVAADRSRNGVSLTCNEQVRRGNLKRWHIQ